MSNATPDTPTVGFRNRLHTERIRLGYTAAQFACLIGIDKGKQEMLERGEGMWDHAYIKAASNLGIDPLYVIGQSDTPQPRKNVRLGDADDPFHHAVGVMVRASEAVNAWFPEDPANHHPLLIAALIQATISQEALNSSAHGGEPGRPGKLF